MPTDTGFVPVEDQATCPDRHIMCVIPDIRNPVAEFHIDFQPPRATMHRPRSFHGLDPARDRPSGDRVVVSRGV
ncbi:hypothetical protein CA982_00700 [Gordonia lacunae]|uniref:Uncharacterized protein n=1 Tax=Gordonia lacunae TaxID=417102 RepID=A0A2C9ZJI5_9ACTN|nr:hypothetical protein CA982_00700 [Gordonia lacunae]